MFVVSAMCCVVDLVAVFSNGALFARFFYSFVLVIVFIIAVVVVSVLAIGDVAFFGVVIAFVVVVVIVFYGCGYCCYCACYW